MSPSDAAKLLDLPADATPEQLEARFLELRRKLEDKIAKAPTPGLQAKYRESLAEITAAFEALTLAADSSALPVLKKEMADRRAEMGTKPSPAPQPDLPSPNSPLPSGTPSRRSGGKEFLIVAALAVLVLAAGGWWVMQTRAENAEKARVAAEQKAEAERQAQLARDKAEQDKLARETAAKAEQAENARLAAAAKIEQERLDLLAVQVRMKLAEVKLAWEQFEREERELERSVSELRSEVRAGRDLPPARRHELTARAEAWSAFSLWLAGFLGNHPIKLGQVKIAELLSARQVDTAAQEATALLQLVAIAKQEVVARQAAIESSLYGTLVLEVEAPDDTWVLTDAFGRRREGRGAARLENLARGEGTLEVSRAGLTQTDRFTVKPGSETSHRTRMLPSEVVLTSPAPGAVAYDQDREIGRLPLTLKNQPPGEMRFEVRAPRHVTATISGVAQPGQKLMLRANLVPESDQDIIRRLARPLQGQWLVGRANSAGTLHRCVTISADKMSALIWFKGWPQPEPSTRETPLVLLDRENEVIGFKLYGASQAASPAKLTAGKLDLDGALLEPIR